MPKQAKAKNLCEVLVRPKIKVTNLCEMLQAADLCGRATSFLHNVMEFIVIFLLNKSSRLPLES